MGGYELARVPGDHFTIWESENLGTFARALVTASDRARGMSEEDAAPDMPRSMADESLMTA